jgi:hypothetical protein
MDDSSPDAGSDAGPIITPPPPKSKAREAPELADIPFDSKAYRDAEIAKRAALLAPYTPETPCLKCGAQGNPDPHHAKLSWMYFVPPHETESENSRRKLERHKLESAFSWMPLYDLDYGWGTHLYPGPNFIHRTCFKCGYTWDELALDEAESRGAA